MTNYVELENNIKEIIDDLQGLCSQNGLSNTAGEEIVVTSVFLYKFLNVFFSLILKYFAQELGVDLREMRKNENDYLDAFYNTYPQDVAFAYEDTIDYLVNHLNDDDFYKQFDETLKRISNYPQNTSFSVETAEGSKTTLFTSLTEYVQP